MKSALSLIFFFLSLGFLYSKSQASSFIHLDTEQGSFHMADRALIFEDKSSTLELQDILLLDKDTFFQDQSMVPFMDFTSSTFWIKLDVRNSQDLTRGLYLEAARPLTNLVQLYILDEEGEVIKIFKTGDDYHFDQRPYSHRKFVFPISFPPQSKRQLIIRAKSDGEILKLPMKFYTTEGLTEFASKENFFLGLYYGFLGLVILLFSFFGIALRQRLYTFFVLYVSFLGLFQFSLDGFAFQYLWPSLPWLGNHAILIFASISIFSLLSYADIILGFSKLNKTYYKVYEMCYVISTLGIIASFSGGTVYAYTFPVLNGFSFLMSFYFFIGIYLKYKKGERPATALTAAFIFLWLGAIVFVASNVNLINSEFLATNALKIASAVEVTFLSIAMVGRYRENQREKIKAQRIAYSRLKEVNELKSKQTEELEKQVKERTSEISEKNSILSQQNKDIINSINYAKRLQDAILPPETLSQSSFKDSAILFRPKDIVSGDFYWIEKTSDFVFFAVADCTGHGVPGAMVSFVGYNALNRCINELKLTDAEKILDQMTIFVEKTFSKNKNSVSDGMDISLCIWNRKNHLQFAGAFNPLYLIRNEELIEYKGDKQPIGKFEKRAPFTKHEIQLEHGDSIYLFSDGYPDQFGGERGKKLKYSNFKKYLLELDALASNSICETLNQRFEEWKGKEEQIDDVCVMNIKF